MALQVRVAWFNKRNKRYYFGEWREVRKDLSIEQTWVHQQNIKYPFDHYWLEGRVDEEEKEVGKNIESFGELIKIEKKEGNKIVDEYLLL